MSPGIWKRTAHESADKRVLWDYILVNGAKDLYQPVFPWRIYYWEDGCIARGSARLQKAIFEKSIYEKLEAFTGLFFDLILFCLGNHLGSFSLIITSIAEFALPSTPLYHKIEFSSRLLRSGRTNTVLKGKIHIDLCQDLRIIPSFASKSLLSTVVVHCGAIKDLWLNIWPSNWHVTAGVKKSLTKGPLNSNYGYRSRGGFSREES